MNLDTGSQTGSNVNTAGACSNTYCHGGKFNQAAYVANYQGSVPTPSWTGGAGQAACGACHKVWPTSQAHGTVTTSTLCSVCHPGYNYSVAGGGNVNPDLHINGKLDGGGGPNCTAVECHGGTSIASRRRVTDDFANGTTPNFRSHHVGNGAQTAITAATGMSATGMGGTLTNNDCYVCHAEAIASSPGVWTTGGLHMNTTIDLRDSDTGMAYPYRKQDITGAAGTWNSSNANWVTETSTNLDPFCNSCTTWTARPGCRPSGRRARPRGTPSTTARSRTTTTASSAARRRPARRPGPSWTSPRDASRRLRHDPRHEPGPRHRARRRGGQPARVPVHERQLDALLQPQRDGDVDRRRLLLHDQLRARDGRRSVGWLQQARRRAVHVPGRQPPAPVLMRQTARLEFLEPRQVWRRGTARPEPVEGRAVA